VITTTYAFKNISLSYSNYTNMLTDRSFDPNKHTYFYQIYLPGLSCGGDVSTDNLQNCDCAFAATLMASGQLVCPEDDYGVACPAGCEVCNNCLAVLGCDSEYGTRRAATSGTVRNYGAWIILASIGFVLVGAVLYKTAKKRQTEENDMTERLLEAESTAPSAGEGIYGGDGDRKKEVWLAPMEGAYEL
jgi:hypothetical protein